MGFLDDLKRQAESARAQQHTDTAALDRNAALANAACHTTFGYLNTLVQQLNVLRPVSRRPIALDKRHVFEHLQLSDFRADARRKTLRGSDVFDHVVLNWRLVSGRRVAIVKDFLPDIEKLESRLRQSGASVQSEAVRNPANGKLQEMRYDVNADFHASVRFTPEHDRGCVGIKLVNLDGLETVTAELPAFELGSARLDELARWLVGEPHRFLDGLLGLRRTEA